MGTLDRFDLVICRKTCRLKLSVAVCLADLKAVSSRIHVRGRRESSVAWEALHLGESGSLRVVFIAPTTVILRRSGSVMGIVVAIAGTAALAKELASVGTALASVACQGIVTIVIKQIRMSIFIIVILVASRL